MSSMKAFTPLLSAAALAVSLAAIAAPSHAAVIAQFSPVTNADDYKWVKSGGSGATAGTGGTFFSANTASAASAQAVAVSFSFLDPNLAALDFLPALFTLSASVASGHPASFDGSTWTQLGLSGAFSFIYNGANEVVDGIHLTHGENLLSGTFANGWIQGSGGSGSANETFDNGGTATYTSQVLDVAQIQPGSEGFALNLLSVSPHFGASAHKALNSFKANGGGNFEALSVPEPATWGLMIMGFGGMGALLRRRRTAMALA